ncbi:hypothetical protein J3Q64DRAFT_1748928 [Phycomyces blakesleeanus]|uniref:F-box domain-containing protein n=2 Tax=Phycomyces blakesleeanus TaxID=4837 RepID=A0A167MT95_PHYB8|nr:hypothetical protein PHYBLDRAFT_145348 [Phycomyces blakesleeanus NRRL 1555(-)]OAD73879.1 hypothetical protein PHYBLDRAFT_145348 [Phycomyces blakesleeanus NRRL 1555(-)]|eukprot:XP_018291919.1 hypothetical protein PHYBLDRAFT_145348 [Phycomyces blakesleeanus NRRL 1555(-)]
MASKLQFNILAIIARHLSQDDICACSRVCKSWAVPFQESLWKVFHINDQKTLKMICDPSFSSQNSICLQKFGHSVYELHVGRHFYILKEQLRDLQQRFGNLRCLYVDSINLRAANLEIMPGRVSWRSVEYLEVSLQWTEAHNDLEELSRLLAFLPCLGIFRLTESSSSQSKSFSWKDIDMVHSHLSQLKEIYIDVILCPIPSEDIETIRDIVPSSSIRKVTIVGKDICSRWLHYFSSKYENLKTFTWNIKLSKITRPGYSPNEKTPVLSLPLSPFRKLVTVDVESNEHESISHHASFWKKLNKFGALPRRIDYKLRWEPDTTEKAEGLITECLKIFSSTVENFIFESYNKYNNKSLGAFNIPMTFSVCPQLVNLDLHMPDSSIALDMLLDCCKALKTLKLCHRRVFIDPETSIVPKEHGLLTMCLWDTSTRPNLFTYLSFRCKQLETMRLNNVSIHGTVSIETGKLNIDMIHTSFKTLEFNSVKYYCPTPYKHNHRLSQSAKEKPINLILIEQHRVELSIIYDIEKKSAVFDTLLSMPVAEPVWIHYYLKSVPFVPNGGMRILGKNEVKYIREYIDEFKENQEIFFSQPTFEDNNYGLEPETRWKRDFTQGCAVWRCQSVSKHIIKAYKDVYVYNSPK